MWMPLSVAKLQIQSRNIQIYHRKSSEIFETLDLIWVQKTSLH